MSDSFVVLQLAFLLFILGAFPALMFLTNRIRDPFHPLLLVGALMYFIAGHRLLTNLSPHLDLMPPEYYNPYLLAAILSILGLYFGWWYAGRKGPSASKRPVRIITPDTVQVSYIFIAAFVCAAVGTVAHFATFGHMELSGYLIDLRMLWITAAILSIQVMYLSTPLRIPSVLVFCFALVPPAERFINYGQRGDTFRLAAIAALFYFTWNRRPTKATFVTAAVGLGLTLATLHMTRALVDEGSAPNRVAALLQVIPRFMHPKETPVDPSDEDVFGSAGIKAVRDSGQYGRGLLLTAGTFFHFLPRGLFPDKDYYLRPSPGMMLEPIRESTGLQVPGGSAPSGIAHGFYDLGWFCWIPWLIFGFFYRKLWDRAVIPGALMEQGLVTGFSIAMVYGIAQDLLTMQVNMVYVMVPVYLIYRIARREPAMSADIPPANLVATSEMPC